MKNRLGCIVLVSMKHGDRYAYPMARSVDTSDTDSMLAFARDFASTLALDSDETMSVFYSMKSDPGYARLANDGEWVGRIVPEVQS